MKHIYHSLSKKIWYIIIFSLFLLVCLSQCAIDFYFPSIFKACISYFMIQFDLRVLRLFFVNLSHRSFLWYIYHMFSIQYISFVETKFD